MRKRLGVLGLLILVTSAGCLGGVGATATIESLDPRVSIAGPPPATGLDGTRTCTYAGPPPGQYGIVGPVDLERPTASRQAHPASFLVQVRLEDREWQTVENVSLRPSDREQIRLFHLESDDGTLSAGQMVEVGVRVKTGGQTVAEQTRTVRVKEGAGCVAG